MLKFTAPPLSLEKDLAGKKIASTFQKYFNLW
jgi:hypothetical protein